MSKKQNHTNNTALSGHNIYKDKRNRTIYYDFITKNGYIVNKEDENKIFIYKNRFAIIIVAATLAIGVFLSTLQGIVAAVACTVIVEAYYRFYVFKRMKVSQSFVRERRLSPIQSILEQKSKGKIIVLIFLYLALAVLIDINAYIENYSIGIIVASGLISIFALYFAVIHIIALFKMKK